MSSLVNAAEREESAIRSARGNGHALSASSAGARKATNDVARGVSESDPGVEESHARTATANLPGVSSAIGTAEHNAVDPRAKPPDPDTGAPERDVQGGASAIDHAGATIGRQDPDLPGDGGGEGGPQI